MRKMIFSLVGIYFTAIPNFLPAQVMDGPNDKALVTMAIRGIEQGIRQHRVELITRFLNETVQDSTRETMSIGRAAQRFRVFMTASRIRMQTPGWARRLPRPDLPANWDFEIQVDSMEITNHTAIARLKYSWLLDRELTRGHNGGKPVRDVWVFEKKRNVWVIIISNRFFRFMKLYVN